MVRGLAVTCGLMLAVSCGSATSSDGDGAGRAGSSSGGASSGGSATGGSRAGASVASGNAGDSGQTSTGGASTGGTGTGGSSTGGSSMGGASMGGASTGGSGLGGAEMGGVGAGGSSMGGIGASGAAGNGGAGGGKGGASGAGGSPGGSGGSAGAGGTTPDPNVTYRACPTIGGVNRMNLFKHDTRRGLCFSVSLSQGAMQTFSGTTAPEGWQVDRAMALLATTACPETGATSVVATGITGSVTWQDGSTSVPENIGADLVLEFPMRMEFPASEPFQASGLDGRCL